MGLYTRADAHLAWLQKYGKQAATNGGYAPLEWMTASPPVDAGPPPVVLSSLGDPCLSPAECESALCVDFGEKLCSKTCTDKSPCPTGFTCNSGYCYPTSKIPKEDAAPPVDDSAVSDDAATATPTGEETVKASSCNVGTSFPPPKPQPWVVAGMAGLAIAVVRRRRR